MQVSLNEPAMEQAWGVIKQLSADEQERLEAEATEKARRAFISRIRAAERKGEANKSIKVATIMLQYNVNFEYISEVSGLSIEAISDIARSINVDK